MMIKSRRASYSTAPERTSSTSKLKRTVPILPVIRRRLWVAFLSGFESTVELVFSFTIDNGLAECDELARLAGLKAAAAVANVISSRFCCKHSNSRRRVSSRSLAASDLGYYVGTLPDESSAA
jgi:hypothetical protein